MKGRKWLMITYTEILGDGMKHIWFWKAVLGERNGQPCRVLCRGKLNSILVEFEDGFRVVTSRFAVRRMT